MKQHANLQRSYAANKHTQYNSYSHHTVNKYKHSISKLDIKGKEFWSILSSVFCDQLLLIKVSKHCYSTGSKGGDN